MASNELGDPVAGYFFTPPEGWRAEQEAGRFALAGPSGSTAAMVIPHLAKDPQEMEPLFEEGWIEPGVELKPQGKATIGEDEAEQPLAGQVQGQDAIGMLVVKYSPLGGGVIVIGLGPAGDAYRSEVESGVRTLAASVRFAAPETGDVVESWDEGLRGKTLTYLHTYSSGPGGGGMTEKHEIHLGEDGSFQEYRESAISVGDVGGGERSSAEGTWTIRVAAAQPFLDLVKPDATDTYTLSRSEGDLYLDDRRFFVS